MAITVVETRHVGRGIGYFEVQKAWALECALRGPKRLYGSLVHSGPAAAPWPSTMRAMMAEKIIMSVVDIGLEKREQADTGS